MEPGEEAPREVVRSLDRSVQSDPGGNHGQHQRQVFHVSRQRPDLPDRIEQPSRPGEVPRAWNPARGRLDAGDPRAVRRETHASPGIAPQAERRTSRRDDGRLAAAASPRRQVQVIGVVRAAVNQVVGLPRPSQFRAIGFSQQNGSGLAQALHHHGVFVRNVVRAALGSARADHSLRLDGVFQRERHAVQGADHISPRQRLVGMARFLESLLGTNLHDGVQAGIHFLDSFQAGAHEFVRGDFLLANRCRHGRGGLDRSIHASENASFDKHTAEMSPMKRAGFGK